MADVREAPPLPHDGTCDACEPDEAKEAVLICQECHFSYCDAHGGEHREKYAGHRVRDYAEALAEEERTSKTGTLQTGAPQTGAPQTSALQTGAPQDADRKNCPIHGQELSLYCKDHSKIICVLCAVTGDHRQHQLVTLNQAYQELKNRKPVDLKLAMGEMVEKLKEKCANPKITRGELKTFIQKEFDHLKHLVNEEETKALHFVDLQEAVASAHVTEVLAELNVHMGKLMAEMAEITRQLNSFNQLVMEKPETLEDDSREEESGLDLTAAGASGSRFQSPPPGNGPW